jgi:kinesin family protein C1
MIPRAIQMIFDVSKRLKGWKYKMEGTFLEVYNDEVSSHLTTCAYPDQRPPRLVPV